MAQQVRQPGLHQGPALGPSDDGEVTADRVGLLVHAAQAAMQRADLLPGIDPAAVVEHPQQVLPRLLPQLDPDLGGAGVLGDVGQGLPDDPHQHPADGR